MQLTNLRRIRQERGDSQRQLSQKTEERGHRVSQGRIHLYEIGLPPRDDADVRVLAEALRVRPAMLTGAPLLQLDLGGADAGPNTPDNAA